MRRTNAGTTLIETLVATAFFLIFSVAIYQLYTKMVELSTTIRVRTVATQLASEQFEFIRNLQYSDVGTSGGIPSGTIPQTQTVTRNNMSFTLDTTIRNVDQPDDGLFPADTTPADNKLVSITVSCTSCKSNTSVTYTSLVAPKSLETENGDGAIVIKAIDANGQPVTDASVTLTNSTLSPPVAINDVTGNDGVLTIVDAPPATQSYQVTVTKNGYSTDQTYAPGGSGNPNPAKPYLTVSAGTVTQATFSIDQLSTLVLKTEGETCSPVGNLSGTFTGSKLIGTSPDVIKHTYNFSTDSSGSATLASVEWDTYLAAISGSAYDLVGMNPLNPLTVPANTTQNVTLMVRPANPNALVVAVTDSTTGLALADASVEVTGGTIDQTKSTTVGSLTQTDWSGGSGQADYVQTNQYASNDAGIDATSNPGEIRLAKAGNTYAGSGTLTSSTIDLGAATTFRQLTWSPANQPANAGATPVQFQIATSATNDQTTVWDFKGPDGTATTYYTAPLTDIATVHNGDRYLRYKLFLSTASSSVTPSIMDISFTYTSGCLPPGQTDFGGLPNGTYTVTTSKAGYSTDVKTITISNDTSVSISLVPSS